MGKKSNGVTPALALATLEDDLVATRSRLGILMGELDRRRHVAARIRRLTRGHGVLIVGGLASLVAMWGMFAWARSRRY